LVPNYVTFFNAVHDDYDYDKIVIMIFILAILGVRRTNTPPGSLSSLNNAATIAVPVFLSLLIVVAVVVGLFVYRRYVFNMENIG